jgi:hypothetical protein
MAVSVTGDGPSLTTGTPTPQFAFRAAGTMTVQSYAVTSDGERFVLTAIVETDPKAALSVVQNWTVGVVR